MYFNYKTGSNDDCYGRRSHENHMRPKSTSLYGISGYYTNSSIDSHPSRFTYNDHDHNTDLHYTTFAIHSSRRTSRMTSVINSPGIDSEEILENLSSVLREKMPTNDILSSSYNESDWLCERDAFSDNIKRGQLKNGISKDSSFKDRYRTSESEKDVHAITGYPKRKFRTRSESEPHDISIMGYNLCEIGKNKERYNNDIYKNDKCITSGNNETLSVTKTPNKKRQSPPKVLLYNNPASPRSPRYSKTGNAKLSPTPRRSNAGIPEFRRCRTKSPSPTYNNSVKPTHIKSKSVTPPPRRMRAVLETNELKPSLVKDTPNLSDDVDNSSVEDDDDFIEEHDGSIISSSDSEDGYKTHAFKLHTEKPLSPTQFHDTNPIKNSSIAESLIPPIPDSLLTPSLFPNVPSYLSFSSNSQKGPEVPVELFKILKWKVTNVMPKLVRNILGNSGMRLLKKTNDWMGTWGKHMKSPCFKTIRPYQKINHLPGSFKVGRKDSCWKNLQKQMAKHGKKEFGFMPKTYILPQDLNLLRKSWPKYAQRNFKWIIKPPASARGTGIKVVNRWAQIPKRKPLIVQRYIERPLLINGSKFDLRLYVLVTSINPLRVYMYHDGLVRFASVKYSDKSDTLNDRCMHLTNYSINKLSSNYSKNEDVNACHGHKWTIKTLWTYLSNRGVDTNRLWAAIRNLVLRTILAGENSIYNMIKLNVESKYSCFELFGFDVLLDSELVPWLLEVNISPSLHSDLPLDAHVKAPLVQAVFNTALYNIPPKLSAEKQREISAKLGVKGPLCYDKRLYINYLSREEKLKHAQFTRRDLDERHDYVNSILDDLTPDDVRCLIVAEDELARSAPLERIFPTTTTHKYLKYTETPRYYNRLLDAWEHRYSKKRNVGIRLLQNLCEQKHHLEVPPAPAKKDSNDKTDVEDEPERNGTGSKDVIQD